MNPLLAPSTLPFGLPDFGRIEFEHLEPALDAGMREQREEVEAIATDPDAPTFANTIEALETSGRLLERAARVFFNLTGNQSTPALRALEGEVAPRLAAHQDAIGLDARLFARIADLHARREELGLDDEQSRLLDRYHRDFVRSGATLEGAAQARLKAVNERLSVLTADFRTRLLEDTDDLAVFVEDELSSGGEDRGAPAGLDGLGEDAVAAAAQAARDRGHASGYLLPLVLPTRQPALEQLHDRALRERIFRASVARGGRGGDHDTRDTLAEIATLRAERAGLLGFGSHADYVIDDQTAGSRDAVLKLLGSMVGPAAERARAEADELEAELHADGHDGPLQAWDWAYYAARVQRSKHAVDTERLRAYFELDRVLYDGVLRAASELYGLAFVPRTDLTPPHPDVRVMEVRDEHGKALGLFLGDFFAREGKRGGAWMSSLHGQSRLLGDRPVVTNTLNIPRPPAGEPALLTPDEVRTLFHEFGHALHALLSDVVHPRLWGTNVPSDFVEFPSQVNEMWAWEPEALAYYARHHETGEPLPQSDIDALLAAQTYGMGYATCEMLAAMLLDQAWHGAEPGTELTAANVEPTERKVLADAGLDHPAIPPRYASSFFLHIFGGGYGAAYYSYVWAEVLDADATQWFREQGGLRRESGEAFRFAVLSRGDTVDPLEAFRQFRGRDAEVGPLLERRGLAQP